MKYLFLTLIFFSSLLSNASAQDSNANTVKVSGIIYKDSNGNKIADGKDKMAKGATVALMTYPAEDGKEIGSSTTNDAGQYSFDKVGAGTYQLVITYPSGLTVLTRPFVVKSANGDLYLAFPVLDRSSVTRFTNLRVVNPGQELIEIVFVKTKPKAKAKATTTPPKNIVSPFSP
jgi:hypothetical protein